jgi:hypothetical protein
MEATLQRQIVEAVIAGELADAAWFHGDDLCDCTFQRIGMWKNPYLAETLEVRQCCIWAALYKQYPEFVRVLPGYFNENTGEWITEPMEWDGEADMPLALWHRQVARIEGTDLATARVLGYEAPKGRSVKPLFYLPWAGEYMPVELGR